VSVPDEKDPSKGNSYYISTGSQPNTYAVMSVEQAKKLYPNLDQRFNVFGEG
jgi:hypothetical protein